MARLTLLQAVAMISMITASSLNDYTKQHQISQVDYYSRGKGGRKHPRTFSGVARARREAKKLRNSK